MGKKITSKANEILKKIILGTILVIILVFLLAKMVFLYLMNPLEKNISNYLLGFIILTFVFNIVNLFFRRNAKRHIIAWVLAYSLALAMILLYFIL